MADNPFGGAAEGIQAGQAQALQFATFKRQAIQQKFERLEKGASQAVDMMGKGYVPGKTKVQLFNQVYAPYLKMTTGVTLPPMQKWDDQFTDHMKKQAQLINDDSIPWADKQKLTLANMSEIADDPRTKDAFTPYMDVIKQHTGTPDVKQVDIGGKTAQAQWDPDTQTFKPMVVQGMGPAVSTSQKAMEQQKNFAEQHAKEIDQLQAASKFLAETGDKQSGVGGLFSRFIHPKAVDEAKTAAQATVKMLGEKMGFTNDEINAGMNGQPVSGAISRIATSQQAPDVPQPPATPDIHPMFLNTPPAQAPTAPITPLAPTAPPPTQSSLPLGPDAEVNA